MRCALSSFDTGVISGALPYIRDDLLSHLSMQQDRYACSLMNLRSMSAASTGATTAVHKQHCHGHDPACWHRHALSGPMHAPHACFASQST